MVDGFPQAYPIYYTTGVTAGDISNQWTVGNLASGTKTGPGSYYIKVCQRSTTNCDQSDNFFTVTSTGGAGAFNPASAQLANTLAALQAQLNAIAAKVNMLRR